MKKNQSRVIFPDGHAQLVTALEEMLDDTILWLKRGNPLDPDWVYKSDVTFNESDNLYHYHGPTL